MKARVPRRALFGASASMLLFGAAGDGKAAELDNHLLATVAELEAMDKQVAAVDARTLVVSDDDLSNLLRARNQLAERTLDMPARTPEGLLAKVRALQSVRIAEIGCVPDGLYCHVDDLVRSFLGADAIPIAPRRRYEPRQDAPNPDAELIMLCVKYDRLEAEYRRLCDVDDDLRSVPPGYDETLQAITATPARTRLGQQLKARAVLAHFQPDDDPVDLGMVWSLVRDIAGEG